MQKRKNKNLQRKIILASNSPRRKELLKQMGLKFKIQVSKVDEKNNNSSPVNYVKKLSLKKTKAVAKNKKEEIIIGADTIVVLKNEIIGKPRNLKDAVIILKKLSNKTHLVITGFTILDTKTNKFISKTVKTKVTFKKLTDEEIKAYVNSCKVLDKAGAYAIQDKAGIFIKEVKGDYFNIVGLPIFSLYQELKKFGINITRDW